MVKAIVVDRDYGSVSLLQQEELRDMLAGKGIEISMIHCLSEDEIITACSEADVIMGTGNPLITAKVIGALPHLKMISRFGIGVNSIDLDAAAEKGIPVTFLPGFCAEELTAHATAMILGLMRNTAYYDRHIRAGEWPKGKYFVPQNIRNCTVGLMGFGAAARPMAAVFGRGFGARIISFDPYVTQEAADKYGVHMVSFETLITESDIISIHVPLTKETKYVFNYDIFKKMKNTAMIINVSRGGIIHEGDLIRALKEGEIRYAGLDVFEYEPLDRQNPLIAMDNVILTPHSGFYGEAAKKNQISMTAEILDKAFNHNIISTRVVANKNVIAAKACKFYFN
ncbi:MAG: C-terminal binding protein [Oscillospiraceae bacterium]